MGLCGACSLRVIPDVRPLLQVYGHGQKCLHGLPRSSVMPERWHHSAVHVCAISNANTIMPSTVPCMMT